MWEATSRCTSVKRLRPWQLGDFVCLVSPLCGFSFPDPQREHLKRKRHPKVCRVLCMWRERGRREGCEGRDVKGGREEGTWRVMS